MVVDRRESVVEDGFVIIPNPMGVPTVRRNQGHGVPLPAPPSSDVVEILEHHVSLRLTNYFAS